MDSKDFSIKYLLQSLYFYVHYIKLYICKAMIWDYILRQWEVVYKGRSATMNGDFRKAKLNLIFEVEKFMRKLNNSLQIFV